MRLSRFLGMPRRWHLQRVAVVFFLSLGLAGCGGGDTTDADRSQLSADAAIAGATPFIASTTLRGGGLDRMRRVSFRIDAKPGSTVRPVHATFSADYLRARGNLAANGATLTLPLFGLYSGRQNAIRVEVDFVDGSSVVLPLNFTSAAYVDPNGIYDRPLVRTARSPQAALGFDYFAMKSALGTPVVIDTDGEIRWVGTGRSPSATSAWRDNGFVVASQGAQLLRLELDGTATAPRPIQTPPNSTYDGLHHNIDIGKSGLLIEADGTVGGRPAVESTLVEVADDGAFIAEWDFAAIISRHLLLSGDDPSALVRPGDDWFHMNAATYDARDDSLIVSSRENFVIKVDYRTGTIKWVFGDPTKYWYTLPSLRAKSLTLAPGGQYPDGQHSVSITPTGDLLLFDNGQPTSFPPPGTGAGELRPFSSVASYVIDDATLSATQRWRFDHDRTIKAPFCSSAYQTPDGSVLINYATADNFTHARLVGLDPQRRIVFDYQYDTSPCATGWNAQFVPFEALEFR
jgi:arylsulfate sulfotransferase